MKLKRWLVRMDMPSSLFMNAQKTLQSYSPLTEEDEEITNPNEGESNPDPEESVFSRAQKELSEFYPNKEEQPKEESIWDQIKNFITSSEPNALEKGLERTLGIAGRGLAKAAGTPADIGLLATYLGQNILREDFPDIGNAPAPEFLKNLTGEELARKYDVATGAKYQPEGFLENAVERGFEFGGSGPLFEGKAALKVPGVLRNLLSALGMTGAEEAGAGAGGQILGALGGAASPDIAKSFTPKGIKTAIAKGVGRLAGDQLNTPVRKAVLEEGIKGIPASIQSKSGVIKESEKLATQNPFAGAKFEDSLEHVNKQVADNFVKKVGQGIQDTFEESVKAGQNSTDFINNLYKKTEEYFGRAYEGIKQEAKDFKIFPKHYADTLEGLEKSLSKTLAESPEKASLLNDIASMKSRLYEQVDNKLVPRTVGLEELINTRTDLNSVYNRIKEFKGAQKFRKTFPQAINADLEKLKEAHPKVYEKLKKLDKEYGNHREAFNNKVIKAIRNEERPEVVVGLIRQPSDLDRVEKVLKSTKNGQRVFDGIKKAKLNQVFSEQFLDARNGVFNYKRYSSLLDMPQVNKWVEKLTTPSQLKAIRNLEKISDGFSEGAKYLTKHPQEIKIKDVGGLSQIVSLGKNLAAPTPKNLFYSAVGIIGPHLLASVYSDPDMIKIMLNTSRAGKKHDMKTYTNGLKKMGKRILQAVEVSPEEEESRKAMQANLGGTT